MPIYEYECSEHGVFEELRPMDRAREGADCPACHLSAPRVLSPTRTNLVPRAVSVAHARNEKSQHAPEHSCKGHHHHAQKPKRPGQAQVYRGKRPWVMEHG
jgi:putative FmdB family regulatory protein